MRTSFSLAFAFTFLAGCEMSATDNPPSSQEYDLRAVFSLSDTDSHAQTHFRKGDNFDLSFSMINRASDTLYYDVGGYPPVIFTIAGKCSVVATSIDGYAFVQIARRIAFLPGDTLRAYWRAPTTRAQKPRVYLTPGVYDAAVTFPTFPGKSISPIKPIQFSVEK